MAAPVDSRRSPGDAEDPDDLLPGFRRERAILALLPLFFVSGGTALVYQTLWNRELHLVFGTSTFAIATVLSAFMAGLALGGAIMARRADTATRPLRVYGLLEGFIGIYALVFPTLVTFVTPIYLYVWRALEPGPLLFGLVQFVLVGVILLLPTAAMGATLPLLARFATDRMGAAGDRVGTLYAVNTAGAVAGTWLAGFVLLPGLGLWNTTLLAAGANVVLGLAALGLDSWAGDGRVPQVDAEAGTRFPPAVLPVAVALGLAGGASLAYEVAWTRVLGLMVGASVYAFSVMLLAFLIGIAIGGKIGGTLADRVLARWGAGAVLLLLAGVELGVGGLSYALMYVFPELPFIYVRVFDALGAADDPSMMWATSLVVSGLVMTPPAVLMGVAFPVAVRAVVGEDEALGGPVGTVYAANTVGGVVGAFAAGFVLLPTVGVQATIFAAALVNLGAAGVALFAARGTHPRAWIAGPVAVVVFCTAFFGVRPPWDPMLMTSGMYHYVTEFEDHSRAGILAYAVDAYEPVFYEEGLSSVVTVARNRTSDNLWLANNGKVDASTTTDMPTQVLCALLPMQYAKARDEVVVIGLASGITAGALTTFDDLGRLDVVELEPAILRAARHFHDWNRGVLDDPRTHLVANDGRNHLLISPESSYDVIISEPSNPWISGVSNLFTEEFWRMGKRRLKPGGVWSQWVQMYGMDDNDLKSLLRTFATVYPHVVVYATIEDADLVLIGSDEPLIPGPMQANRLFEQDRVREALAEVEVHNAFDLLAMFQFDRADILAATEGSVLNTDDNMRIEYNAPLNLHRDTFEENMLVLLENAAIPDEGVTRPADWAALAEAYERRSDSARAMLSYQRALKDGDPDSMAYAEWKDALGAIIARIRASAEP